jgi:SAM-dependent methyltransferase
MSVASRLKQLTRIRIRNVPIWYFLYWPHALWNVVCTIPSGSSILDVGCGEGGLLKALRSFRPDLTLAGIDMYKAQVPEGISFAHVDFVKQPFPFEGNQFDYVFMTHVIEHLEQPCVVLEEIQRVLKPRGILYIEAPSTRSCFIPSIGFGFKQGMPINFYDDPSHIRPYSKCAFWSLLKHNFIPLHAGYAINWLRFLISPVQIVLATLLRKRWYLATGIWSLTGWAVYAVASKPVNDNTAP